MWGSLDPILEFWDPPNISRTVEARNFKFCTETEGGEYLRNKFKIGSKGVTWGHVTQFWNFGVPLISRERLKLETSNLARRRMAMSPNEKNSKLAQKGSCEGHVTQFWNFGTPLIWLKLETSNLARRWMTVSSNEKQNSKLGQKRSCGGHVTQFWKFGTF